MEDAVALSRILPFCRSVVDARVGDPDLPSAVRSAILLESVCTHLCHGAFSQLGVSAHHDLCSTAFHPHPTSPTGLSIIDASSRACFWHCILTRCSNFCAVRALGDDATGRSSAVCHYSATQKGLSPNIWKTYQRPWSHQAVSFHMCQHSHLWTGEQKEQPSLGWAQPVAMAQQWQQYSHGPAVAQYWIDSDSGTVMAQQ